MMDHEPAIGLFFVDIGRYRVELDLFAVRPPSLDRCHTDVCGIVAVHPHDRLA